MAELEQVCEPQMAECEVGQPENDDDSQSESDEELNPEHPM